ncbi:neural cell adhesion molecule 2-like isoform X2 [Argopecten irradians]|uniref:neural cell adhesion molecule 2-like isoform X2 n=1 Tax=Argopecten irradians TaxID=31199 RepID=UPI003718F3A6
MEVTAGIINILKVLSCMQILISMLPAVSSQAFPTVSIPTQTYATNPGENIAMVCNVSANPTHTSVQWQKSVNGFFQAVNIVANSRYSGGTVISPSLVITGAVTGDTGTYRCTANNSVGSKNSRNTQLTITKSALTVTIPKSAYSTNSGGTVTLTCQISADPTYTSLHWLKLVNGNYQYVYSYENSRYSGGTFASPSLTISGALTTDAGAYLCAAANQFGTGTSVIQLSVSPVIPTVSIPTPTYATNSGGTITMVCNVNADPTHTSVSWEKNTNGVFQPVNIGGTTRYSRGTVTLPSLFIIGAVTGDTGTYRCTATNSVGTGTSGNTQLTITGSPPTVTQPLVSYSTTVGGTVTLVCSVNSTSNITNLYWEKQVSITTNSRYSGGTTTSPDFVITNAQTADAGTYRCSAANHYGTTYSQSTLLTVAGCKYKDVLVILLKGVFVNFEVICHSIEIVILACAFYLV